MKTKDEIIESMCLTFDHRFLLPCREEIEDQVELDDYISLLVHPTKQEKEHIRTTMRQLFENDIEPYMDFKK